METKRCRKCDSIYPAYDFRCPSCGSRKARTRKKISISNAAARDTMPVATWLIDVRQKELSAIKIFLMALLFGRLSLLWAFFRANKQSVKEASFSVEYESGRQGTETVPVGSSRYFELLKYRV